MSYFAFPFGKIRCRVKQDEILVLCVNIDTDELCWISAEVICT